MKTSEVSIRRAYDPPGRNDGRRILVDRVWPRGVSKARLDLYLWAREAAPSTALRRWFGHDPDKWDEFRERYFAELRQHPEVLSEIREALEQGSVTLVYGASDRQHNQAVALAEFLRTEP